jgi:hypothetical protein
MPASAPSNRAAGRAADGDRGERAGDHDPFEPDVDDARTFAQHAAERGVDQRRRLDEREREEREHRAARVHVVLRDGDDAPPGERDDHQARDQRDDVARHAGFGLHRDPAALQHAERERRDDDPQRIEAADQRDRDRDETVARRQSGVEAVQHALTIVAPPSPAIAPEIAIATSAVRPRSIPARLAASGASPAARSS